MLFDGANSVVLLREIAEPPGAAHCAAADRRVRGPQARGAHLLRLRSRAGDLLPGRVMAERAAGTRWTRRLVLALLLAPALLWLLALIILPHVDLALLSFRERVAPREYAASLAQYRTFFGEPLYWHVFLRTALLSALATALTLLVAFPIAWIIAKLARGRMSALLFVVCLIPFWVSETVRTLGWMILLRESGVLPAAAHASRYHRAAGRAPLPRRDDPRRPRLYLAPLHGGAAGRESREPRQRADRGRLRSRRQGRGRSCARSSSRMPRPASPPAASWCSC